jgi:enoyl-CoA hydratase/carnithine racemase
MPAMSDTQMWDTVLTETRGDVRILTMNRPDRLNAWTPHMGAELVEAIEAADADAGIGAVVLTGAGRGFCAGADMSDTFRTRIDGTDPGGDTAHGQGGFPAGVDWVATCRRAKPLVAAVNGAAVGIGMTQILPFDSIVASEDAKFGMAFIKVGLVPELASTQLLVQRIGWGMALQLCLSGRIVAADEAHRIGLADHVAPADDLLDTAVALAASYAANPAPQLRMIKELLTANAVDTDLTEIQRRESALLRECWETPEHAEAVSAFLDKRTPDFGPRR